MIAIINPEASENKCAASPNIAIDPLKNPPKPSSIINTKQIKDTVINLLRTDY
jgi:hypothetical protein